MSTITRRVRFLDLTQELMGPVGHILVAGRPGQPGVEPPGGLPPGLTPQYTPKRRGVPHLVDEGQETPPEVKAFVARMMRPP